MNARLGFHGRAWLLCTVTCLFWCLPARVQAESTTDTESRQSETSTNPQSNLKSAIQQELEELFQRDGKQAPNMMRSAGTSRKTAQGATRQRVSPQAKRIVKSSRNNAQQTAAQRGEQAVSAGSTANGDGLTKIQRELKQLYEKDGKQMPTVDFSELSQRAGQTRTQLQQQPAAGTATVQSPGIQRPIRTNQAPQKRLGLLQRLNPFRSRGGRKNHPNIRRRAMRRRELAEPTQRRHSSPPRTVASGQEQAKEAGSRPRLLPRFLRPQAIRNSVARPINPQEIVARPSGTSEIREELPEETEILDAEFDEDVATGDRSLVSNDGEIARSQDEEQTARVRMDDLGNPFTEVSEAEADVGRIDENPFTGLTLDTPEAPAGVADDNTGDGQESAEDEAVTVAGSESALPDDDTADVEEETNEQQESKVVADADAPSPFDAEQGGKKTSKLESKRLSKLAQIARRVDQSGLKGFCPVVLRDLRDLVDAKPEYVTSYQSKEYHFSSAEAKARFEAHPELYAPVSGGMDVIVQAARDEEVEGTLDHAVWFRNRLYLFSSADTMHAFVQQPAKYAVEEE